MSDEDQDRNPEQNEEPAPETNEAAQETEGAAGAPEAPARDTQEAARLAAGMRRRVAGSLGVVDFSVANSIARYASTINSMMRVQDTVRPILDSYRRIEESVQPLLDSAQQVENTIRPILESYRLPQRHVESYARIERMVRDSVSSYATYAEMVRESVEDAVRPIAQFVVSDYFRQLQGLTLTERRMRDSLSEVGCWFPPSASREALWDAGERALARDRIGLRHAMTKLARGREMSQMVARWVTAPVFRERERFIRDGLHDHRAGRYRVSVPTLLPLIEGIAIAEFDPFSRATNPRRAIDSAAATYRTAVNGAVVDTVTFLWSTMDFSVARPSSRQLNRHFVLHGRSTAYGTEENSARVLFALDQLHSLVAARHAQAVAASQPAV